MQWTLVVPVESDVCKANKQTLSEPSLSLYRRWVQRYLYCNNQGMSSLQPPFLWLVLPTNITVPVWLSQQWDHCVTHPYSAWSYINVKMSKLITVCADMDTKKNKLFTWGGGGGSILSGALWQKVNTWKTSLKTHILCNYSISSEKWRN
jgi:hypothetical protein